MDSPVRTQIREVENRWYSKLKDHCQQIFSGIFLPSHDEVHHSRVWFHARDLLQMIHDEGIRKDKGINPDKVNPGELILSVFFHDTGLSRTPGEKHGRESKQIFDEYCMSNQDLFGDFSKNSIQRIRYAIEHHDDKSPTPEPGSARSSTDLLDLLSTADDLDAFGLPGIYRYAEIYMLRGIKPGDLPALVSRLRL